MSTEVHSKLDELLESETKVIAEEEVPTEEEEEVTPEQEEEEEPKVEQEEEAEEEAEEEEIPEEPKSHGERSKLGRRLAKMEKDSEKTNELLSTIMEELQKQKAPAQAKETDVDLEDDDFDLPTSKKELYERFEEFYQIKKSQESTLTQSQQEEQQKYQEQYLSHVDNIGIEDEGMHQKVYDLMLEKYNLRRSDDPKADAELNYNLAKGELYGQLYESTTQKKPNLKQEMPKQGMDTAVDTTHKQSDKPLNIPEDAVSFMKAKGISEERARKVLTSR